MDLFDGKHKVVMLGAAALAAGVFLLSVRGRGADEGEPYANIVNLPAPEWSVRDWINSEPLALAKLRGKAVLIRWWTGPGCPYCVPSTPRLNELFHRYKSRGLMVVGFYHHKSEEPLRIEEVSRLAKEVGIDFPVAVDHGWKTLKRYWLDRVNVEPWTSVSFLIDQDGVVRYVHPGGTMTKADAKLIEREIVALLKPRRRNQ